MDDLEKARLLLRLAGKNPQESRALIAWADDLLGQVPGSGSGRRSRTSAAIREQLSGLFPLPVFIETPDAQSQGTLFADARMQIGYETYKSPSGAAVAVLGYPDNGWRVWKFIDTEGRTQSIDVLRRQGLM
jgi:hypothetical protein